MVSRSPYPSMPGPIPLTAVGGTNWPLSQDGQNPDSGITPRIAGLNPTVCAAGREKPASSPTSSISRTVPACWGRRRQQDWQVTSPSTNLWQTGTRTRICAVSTINGGPHASWPQTKGVSFSAEEVPSLAAYFPRSRIVTVVSPQATAVGGVRHRNEPSPARRFRFHADRPDPPSRPAQTGARPPHQNSRWQYNMLGVQFCTGHNARLPECW